MHRIANVWLLVLLAAPVCAGPARPGYTPPVSVVQANSLRLPLAFEANRGQYHPGVRFVARSAGSALFLTDREAVVSLPGRGDGKAPGSVLLMRMIGASAAPAISGMDRLPGTISHFRGRDRSRWLADIPTFGRVRYSGIYPGTDLVFYGNSRRLEYDFVVAPGADPRRISLAFAGADRLSISQSGDLVASTPSGDVRLRRPYAYQGIHGKRVRVPCTFRLGPTGRVGFQVARYDVSRPLVVDPVVEFARLGTGGGDEYPNSVAVDPNTGAIWIAGYAANWPPGFAGDLPVKGPADALLMRMDPSGATVTKTVYLGGDGFDEATALAIAPNGMAFVAGNTRSPNFPTTPGALQATRRGDDGFVTALTASGSQIVYSTLIGGSGPDRVCSVSVDALGQAVVAGNTSSTDLPTTPDSIQPKLAGLQDGFMLQLNASGSGVVAGSYFGGSSDDEVNAMSYLPNGAVTLAGTTLSRDLPITKGAYQKSLDWGATGFVARLVAGARGLGFSTYIGGCPTGSANGLYCDTGGRTYVAGDTWVRETSPTMTAYQRTGAGRSDAFVAQLSATGGLGWLTYFGGEGEDAGCAIVPGPDGSLCVLGTTTAGVPVTPDAWRKEFAGQLTPFLCRFDRSGSKLLYSSLVEGNAVLNAPRMASCSEGSLVTSVVLPAPGSTLYPRDAHVGLWSFAPASRLQLEDRFACAGEAITLTVSLRDAGLGSARRQGVVSMTVYWRSGPQTKSVSVGSTGTAAASFTLPSDAVGEIPIAAYHAGNSASGAAYARAVLRIVRPSAISVSNAYVASGARATVTARVVDPARDEPLPGLPITWSLAGSPTGQTSTTDSQGYAVATLAAPASAVGTRHQVVAAFAGSNQVASSRGEGSLVIVPTAIITVPAASASGGRLTTLRATLAYSGTNQPAGGKPMRFYVDGVEITREPVSTSASGEATVDYTPALTDMGTQTVRADFAGDASLAAASGTGALTVAGSTVIVTVPPLRATAAGADIGLKAVVTRPDGRPLPGVVVTFKVRGIAAGNATTDGQGVASRWYVAPPLATRDVLVEASAPAIGDLAAGRGTATLRINPHLDVALVLSPQDGVRGGQATLSAQLEQIWPSGAQTPIVGESVEFYRVLADNTEALLGIATSGEEWTRLRFTVPNDWAGRITIGVRYRGNERYERAEKLTYFYVW